MTTLATLPAVETPHIVLREIEMRDCQAFTGFMTQETYQRHIALKLANEAEVKAFVQRSVARQGDERRNVFHLAAEEKSSGEAVGDGFLIVQRPKLLEIGWGVHPAMWAMGFGTEIGRALLGLAFERLKAERIWCKVMAENEASKKLARRIGLRHVQSHADYPAGAGRFAAVEVLALTAAEYFDLPY
ncbi:MAG: GNAT family N-acetyltransferase [Rhizobiales bacterium]|nr:GNAT family N-acetyltransferase [Hyphomicrobiales bacterium]